MLKLKYKQGSMFDDLRENVIYLHACNGQGVWGSGVAKQFRKLFPQAYEIYHNNSNNTGEGYIIRDSKYLVGCLITSKNYGRLVSSPEVILRNTESSLRNMLKTAIRDSLEIYSPKINSGLFKTPWEDTEAIIKKVCNDLDIKIKWTVWELK